MFDDPPLLPFEGKPSAQRSEMLLPRRPTIGVLLTPSVAGRRAERFAVPIAYDLARTGWSAVEHKEHHKSDKPNAFPRHGTIPLLEIDY
jgi:hypothetical protein